MVRNASITHIVDADQRNVELQGALAQRQHASTCTQAGSGNVLPPGPYMLFVNREVDGCVKPSKAAQRERRREAARSRPPPVPGAARRRSARATSARVRLGRTRNRLLAEPRLAKVGPAATRPRQAYRYCVKGGKGRVMAVFGRRTRFELVTTTGPLHGNRGIRPGASTRELRKAFPRAKRITQDGLPGQPPEPAPDRRAQGQGALLRRGQQAHAQEQEAAPRVPAPGRPLEVGVLRAAPRPALLAAAAAGAGSGLRGRRRRSRTGRTRPRSRSSRRSTGSRGTCPGSTCAVVRGPGGAAAGDATGRGREYRVLAKGGDAFIRIGPAACWPTSNSVTWYRSGNPDGVADPPEGAGSAGRRGGRRSRARPAWTWFDHRMHPGTVQVGRQSVEAQSRARLDEWKIPGRLGSGAPGRDGTRGVPAAARERGRRSGRAAAARAGGAGPAAARPAARALYLVNTGARPVTVLGREGEPFARIARDGVEVNQRSITAAEDAVAKGQRKTRRHADSPGRPCGGACPTGTAMRGWMCVRRYRRSSPPDSVTDGTSRKLLDRWQVPVGGRWQADRSARDHHVGAAARTSPPRRPRLWTAAGPWSWAWAAWACWQRWVERSCCAAARRCARQTRLGRHARVTVLSHSAAGGDGGADCGSTYVPHRYASQAATSGPRRQRYRSVTKVTRPHRPPYPAAVPGRRSGRRQTGCLAG